MSESDRFRFDAGRVRHLQHFQDLMPFRVHNILLVSSLYDSFILAEDGQLGELVLHEFLELNLHHTPGLSRVSTGAEAIERVRGERPYNLIVTSLHLGDMDAVELARQVKKTGLDIPVVVLAFSTRELKEFTRHHDLTLIDRLFLWQGDVRILLAIVKYVEDKRNVAHDHEIIGVQSVIVIEDNVRFYSSFLPLIYTELVNQSQKLLREGVNLSQKLLRMRARPKILLCDNFEDAWEYFERYGEDILGIVSDIQFPHGGRLSKDAGVEYARQVRAVRPDVPIMLQSSLEKNRALAEEVGAGFLLKGSRVLHRDLRNFMHHSFAFGDFVFRDEDGREVGRAHDLRSLETTLATVPARSLKLHGSKNDFSNWLKARTEFALANRLRARSVDDFATLEDLRQDLISSIREYRQERSRGQVADFDAATFDATGDMYRMGSGSLGGKARGLAFTNFLLTTFALRDRLPDVRVAVPQAVVLATDVFDEFLDGEDLREYAVQADDDAEIERRFLGAKFPDKAREDLTAYLRLIRHPLAVRSSSLLEDSAHLPFAGIYETYMLPNNEADLEIRLDRVIAAIKRVYASTFTAHAKAYLEATPYRLEEEKMAVILQKIVGGRHGNHFYPDFAGVARSHNFYPSGPMKYDDGVAAVALGLGETVVEGETALRFSPRYPKHLAGFSSVDDVLNNSQRFFYAIDMEGQEDAGTLGISRCGLEVAEKDGVLASMASTYSPENDAVYDGLSRAGIRLVSFAPILKHNVFPLAEVLRLLLELGSWGTGSNVELEFAVNLSTPPGEPKEFGFLQMRPQAVVDVDSEQPLEAVPTDQLLIKSPSVMGHGKILLRDLVVVDYKSFDRSRTREAAQEVARFNARLMEEQTPYVLIGVGRWGSADPWLGIPATWDQVAGARVIVESGFSDFRVSPSQGSHFFHNLTAADIGYFTVNPEVGDGMIDWDWLAGQPALLEGTFFRHLRFADPMTILMNGREQAGIILKPGDTG